LGVLESLNSASVELDLNLLPRYRNPLVVVVQMLQALLPTMEVAVKVKKMKENISTFRYVMVCSPSVKILVLDQNSKFV
jgi:hypothetical protein